MCPICIAWDPVESSGHLCFDSQVLTNVIVYNYFVESGGNESSLILSTTMTQDSCSQSLGVFHGALMIYREVRRYF